MNALELQELAKSKFDLLSFKKTLKERISTQLVVTHNNGLFKATPELITLVYLLNQKVVPHSIEADDSTIYLEDSFGNPVKADGEKLFYDLVAAHQYAHNAWHIEYEESKKLRKLDV